MHLHKGWNTRTPSAWKHCLVQHVGVRPEFSMLVVGVHKSPLVRQVNKAVPIMILKSDCIIDSQTKFRQAPLVRVVPMSGLKRSRGQGEADSFREERAEGEVAREVEEGEEQEAEEVPEG